MKRFILFLVTILAMSSIQAQVSYGPYVSFPNNSFAYAATNPQLAFGKIDNSYLLVLKYVDDVAYRNFDQTSQLLLKFGNEIVHVPMSKKDTNVAKKFDNKRIGNVTANYYITYTSFDIDEDVVKRIVEKKENISKIRVIFANGDLEDFEIKDKYQPKLIKGLVESYDDVSKKDSSRKQTMNNDESGF